MKPISKLPIFFLLTCLIYAVPAVSLTRGRGKASSVAASNLKFRPVDSVIEQVIKERGIPGAVLVVGHKGKVVYRKAYGHRAIVPKLEPMTMDTVFDIASLTKVIATTPSLMRMLQLGQIRLNDPIGKYIPEFATNGKEEITIRELMTHYSGLGPDLDLTQPWNGRDTAFRMIAGEKPIIPPDSQFLYSDINFEILGFLVERISGLTLDKYSSIHVFQPLKMKHTTFLPPASWLKKIAPTQYDENHVILRGAVHDPTARRMGGVAGHAGLFSTADDLAKYAQELLTGTHVLSRASIEKMSTPQQPPTATSVRGLGWDIDSPFSSNRGELLPVGSYGHTGFTGTSIWIDPFSQTYVVLLTNAVHPDGPPPGGPVIAMRGKVIDAITTVLKIDPDAKTLKRIESITGYNEAAVGSHRPVARNGKVLNGIDVLEASEFAQVRQGRAIIRVGLLTNQTGIDVQGRRTIDVLNSAPGIKLAALFSPEHGAIGERDTTKIGNSTDPATNVPIYSVYGGSDAARHPPLDVLKDLDAIVIDIQDVGARFYTYETTMGYFLEAAAKTHVPIFVLDRPNPIGGAIVQGPISDTDQSFVNYHPLPTRHGMTIGELAQLFNGERQIHADLTVVPMQGWERGDWFDSTGQIWINQSPNMRSLTEAALYTGVALVEGTNVSVGRGTNTPFEVVGAPWIKPQELSDYLNGRRLSGVRFMPVSFTPDRSFENSKLVGQKCGGVNIMLTDRYALDAPEVGLEIASALIKLYPKDFQPERMIQLLGNTAAFNALIAGGDPRHIADKWRDQLDDFQKIRNKYLIYK